MMRVTPLIALALLAPAVGNAAGPCITLRGGHVICPQPRPTSTPGDGSGIGGSPVGGRGPRSSPTPTPTPTPGDGSGIGGSPIGGRGPRPTPTPTPGDGSGVGGAGSGHKLGGKPMQDPMPTPTPTPTSTFGDGSGSGGASVAPHHYAPQPNNSVATHPGVSPRQHCEVINRRVVCR